MSGHNVGVDVADDELVRRLAHVYWLGGASGAGKSTIAARLAERLGLHLYSTDDVMPDHARRSTAESSPHLAEFVAMSMDERWVDRSPEAMLDSFHWYRGEAFDLIVEDLLALPPEPVIAEGFRLLPASRGPAGGARQGSLAAADPAVPAGGLRGARLPLVDRELGPVIPNVRCTTCWNATRCSPNGCAPTSRARVVRPWRSAWETPRRTFSTGSADCSGWRCRHADSGVWPNLGKTLDGLIQS